MKKDAKEIQSKGLILEEYLVEGKEGKAQFIIFNIKLLLILFFCLN